MRQSEEKGFILPLAVLLVLILTISGTSVMQLDFLERRMGMNEVENHGSFYLANAGIERAREVFKIDTSALPSWSPILNGTTPGYAIENPANPLLCPDPTKNCIIPPFGSTVTSATIPSFPFDAAFAQGSYSVRAFNNTAPGETSTVDQDGILVFRALGTVLGEQKLLETNIVAVSQMDLINCQGGAGSPCPNSVSGSPTQDFAPGRAPSSKPALPTLDYPLLDSRNFYRTASHFPSLTARTYSGSIQDNSYYFIQGNATIQNTESHDNVLIFATGALTVRSGVALSHAILIGGTSVEFQGSVALAAPLPYPAVISGGDVAGSSGAATIHGTVYAVGIIDFNPIAAHGVLIGNQVRIHGSSVYTDDHSTDPNYLKYYALMPGFVYPPELKTTTATAGSWKEIQ